MNVDKFFEARARMLAHSTSRRSFLALLGAVMIGRSRIPLLPIARGAEKSTTPGYDARADASQCGYWRNCGMDGFMCGCCGGSSTVCPPGTEMSPLSWVGTCRNPTDERNHIIAYHDCCGKSGCNRCMCSRQEGVLPNYVPAKASDINWCMGAKTNVYHCTVTLVMGAVNDISSN